MLLHELFDHAARAFADRIAIDVPPGRDRPARQQTTYAELDGMAAQLAAAVRPFVAGECVCAVLLPRDSPLLYAAQLAILRAGAAWVCLDPAFPDAHAEHVLADAQAVVLLTDRRHQRRAARYLPAERILCCDPILAAVPPTPAPAAPAPPWLHAQSLAYVIYTSGTTGRPKGVLIEHRGIASLIRSGVERFRICPGDRIAQGSSPAYDSSLEETFLALAAGATVVVLDDETVRLGPDLVAWLRRERVTVLCPPPTLLRAIDCADPRVELPDLRLCYAGGEAMPQDLADLWARALWLENGYGPTECTVTVVRGRLQPGEPVTIGAPVPGNEAFVLDEALQPVGEGLAGELCIGGIGLARGYLGQPDLTAQRFVQHPEFGRIYRTGDLVRRDRDGRLCCLGRIDSQVKVRGHRIELEAIETALARCPGVREAACRVQGSDGDRSLVAFVVPDDAARPPAAQDLQRALRAELPAHMVPAAYGVRAELPRTVGGKLDRRAIGALPFGLAAGDPNGGAGTGPRRAPRDDRERQIAAAFAACLGGQPVDLDDDFFALGGDSLRAARLVSQLRRSPATAALTVRDVYQERTVARLAARAAAAHDGGATPGAAIPGTVAATAAASGRPLLVTALQTMWLVFVLAVTSAAAWLGGFVLLPRLGEAIGLTALLLLAPLLGAAAMLAFTALSLWFAVLLKELLIGRYRAGRHPLWGSFHLRHWLVVRAAHAVPWSLLQGTVFHNAALRTLGARIGRRVHFHRGVDLLQGGWDLLEIGDDATLAQEASPGVIELERGHLVLGPVRLRAGSTLDVRAGVGPDTEVGAGAFLSALSFLPGGGRIPADERWYGVPARPAGRTPPRPAGAASERQWTPVAHGLALLGLRLLSGPLLWLPFLLLATLLLAIADVDAVRAFDWLCGRGPLSEPVWMWAPVGLAVAALPVHLLLLALLLRWTRAVPAGTFSRWSPAYLRIWWRTGVVQSAGDWLSGTLLWPAWLRLAGMRIGPRCEISAILDVLPEQVEIGAESFLADGIYLGVPRLQAGTVTVARTRLGPGTFLGNHVVVHGGQDLPPGLLLGVSTVADMAKMPAGSSWFGQPPFALPRREVVTADRRLTHEPGLVRRFNRLFWEALRGLLPALPVLLALLWFEAVCRAIGAGTGFFAAAAAVAAATLGVGAVLAVTVVVLKWLLLGRVRPGQHALWSCWASRWDFLYVAWNRYARALLAHLEGTLLLGFFLRATGMKVGRRVALGDGFAQVVDPDMLELEDGATVQAMFQAHSFEDRVLKIDRVRIGKGACVGRGVVVLYGADVGDGACVAPHSVVMKHERLSPGRHYGGAPVQELPSAAAASAGAAEPVLAAVPAERDPALDLARGLAVLGMVFLHFVPGEAEGGAVAGACASATELLHGKPAALFLVLAGMSFAIQAARRAGPGSFRYFARRALALGATGALLWALVWPTEVLLPIALMLPLVVAAARRGPAAALLSAGALLLAVPFAISLWGHLVDVDCLEDGTHLANHEVSLATLRYFLFDGSYPLLPWLAFPLLGAAMVAGGYRDPARARRWFWVVLPLAMGLQILTAWAEADEGPLGEAAPWLAATWQPTSVPFALLVGSWAVVVVSACVWWCSSRGLAKPLLAVATVGRASLSHYLLHILLVYAPLRLWWPAEDWSVGVGFGAAIGYVVIAVAASRWWFGEFRRGPFEWALARASGGRVPMT